MIADALFSLMKRKSFQQITVTEICEEAAIGRKTFYRNFELREDIIEFQLDYMCREYKAALEDLSLEEYLFHHFFYIYENKDFFITLYQNGFHLMANEKFSVLIPDTMPVWTKDELEQEYRSAYIIAGIEAMQRIWISRGCQESIENVVSYVIRAQDKQVPVAKQ